MKVLTPEEFVQQWRKGNIAWNRHVVMETPFTYTCPRCGQNVVIVEDRAKKQPFSVISGSMALFIPEDTPIDLLDKIFEMVRNEHLERQKKETTKTEETEEKGSPDEVSL
jgi:transcription elongation factor Elf1